MAFQISLIEPVLFICSMNLFLNIPTEKQLIYNKVCLSHYNETFCKTIHISRNHSYQENKIHGETAQWSMYSHIVRIIPTIVSTINLGSLSDLFGRKKVLIVAILGETLCGVSNFLNAWYITAPIPFIFIGSLITGCCGNFPVILMSTLAYVGDLTSEETRTVRIIILDTLIFISSVISFFAGGMILLNFGFRYVYGLVLIFYIMIITYTLFLKESYHPTQEISIKDALCKKNFGEYMEIFLQRQPKYHNIKVGLLMMSFVTLFFVTSGIDQVLLLYLLHTPLSFNPASIGYVLASESSIKFVGSVFLSLVFVKRFGCRDSSIILLCSLAVAGYSLSLAFSRKNYDIYLSTLWGLGVCGGVAACRSGLSKTVGAEAFGKLNSVVCILQEICLLLGSIVFNSTYKYTVHITPSFTLFILGGFSSLPILISILLKLYDIKGRAVEYESIE